VITAAIVDYGCGNVRSVLNAVESCGFSAVVTDDSKKLDDASHIILPGVGSFRAGVAGIDRLVTMDHMKGGRLDLLHRQAFEKGKPFLGICLGMQLLATGGHEDGFCTGFGWIPGTVDRFERGLPVPHTGWNNISLVRPHPLFDGLGDDHLNFYFTHSYHFDALDRASVLATCEYGVTFDAVVARDNIVGVQFHPEKSQDSGIKFLDNFLNWNP
tara:strand:- start:39 stop:680 length:642 start_codon:yes stop_codon:yes gene_type:complete